MTGDLGSQPRCKSQICKAAHNLDQNIGKRCARSSDRFLFCNIHTAKPAAVASSNAGEKSVTILKRSQITSCLHSTSVASASPAAIRPSSCNSNALPRTNAVRTIMSGLEGDIERAGLNIASQYAPVRMQLQSLYQNTHDISHIARFKKIVVHTQLAQGTGRTHGDVSMHHKQQRQQQRHGVELQQGCSGLSMSGQVPQANTCT